MTEEVTGRFEVAQLFRRQESSTVRAEYGSNLSADGYIGGVEGSRAMVQREKVTDAKGRQWVSGSLDSDVYFADVRRKARAQAERIVAARLSEDPQTRRSANAPA